MITSTFSKLRNKAKYYFDEVKHGETVQIFRHGKPIALLVPVRENVFSRWKTARPLQIPGISPSKAIIAER